MEGILAGVVVLSGDTDAIGFAAIKPDEWLPRVGRCAWLVGPVGDEVVDTDVATGSVPELEGFRLPARLVIGVPVALFPEERVETDVGPP